MPDRYHNIVLTGFMGTGKSTVGPLLANALGFRFVDTDALIVAEASKPIPQIFEEEGEAAFRRLEVHVCEHIAWEPDTVIATGGGALLSERVRNVFLAWGMVVCLHATLATIRQRVRADPNRPLLNNAETLYNERREAYATLPYHITTDDRTPHDVVQEIVILWQR